VSAPSIVRTASPAPLVEVPPAGEPRVSFVLVTYGTGPIVTDAIGSIVATTDGMPIEVIVVDNPHPRAVDRSFSELALSTRGVRVLRAATNLGFGGGCNAGAALARAPVLALINPDVTVSVGWIAPLLDVIEGDDTATIVAPVLLDEDGSVQECGQLLYADGTTRPRRQRPPGSAPFEVDHASAACWLLRTEAFRRLGGFDEDFHPAYFEDVDFILRARRDGGRCVVHPGVAVTHASGKGTPDTPPPAHPQRELLISKWPELATTAPIPPSG
jgi:GT2 family glycosyltransferase